METEANKIIKQPSYRFAGYTESWEDKKLGEIVERITRKNKNLESELPLTISAQHGLINQETFFNKKVASKDVSGYYLLKKGEFAYNKSYSSDYPWGAVKRLENYEMGVLSTLYIVFRPNSIDSDFLAVYYDSPKWYKEVSMRAAEGARNHGLLNISPQDFFDTELIFPVNQSEQTAIGSFFQDIDQLISLQQRKLEVLKEQKKTYLKLLFPAKGQTKPALRFAGFEDEWKEVKLGDLILKGGSGGTPKSTVAKYYGGDIPFLSITDISNSGKYLKKTEKTITNEGLQNSSAWVVPEGAISLAMYASVGKLAILGIDCATSQAFYNMVFEDDIVRNFVYTTLEKANIYNEWGSLISTGTQANLNAEKVKNFSFLHPSKPEQEAIGSFFQDLDKAITKQEEKVNQLKESKQTLLRKMFI